MHAKMIKLWLVEYLIEFWFIRPKISTQILTYWNIKIERRWNETIYANANLLDIYFVPCIGANIIKWISVSQDTKMELVFNILEIEYVLIVDFVTRLKICVIPNVNFAIPWQSQVIKLVLVKSYSTSYHYVLIEFVVNYTKISLQFQ